MKEKNKLINEYGINEKERIIGKVREYLEAEPRGITDEYPTFLEELTNVINEAWKK